MNSIETEKLQVKIKGFWHYVSRGGATKLQITDRPETAAGAVELERLKAQFPKTDFRVWTPQPLNDLLAARAASNFRLALRDFSPGVEIEPEDLERVGIYKVRERGSENLYFTAAADGNDYFCKCL